MLIRENIVRDLISRFSIRLEGPTFPRLREVRPIGILRYVDSVTSTKGSANTDTEDANGKVDIAATAGCVLSW